MRKIKKITLCYMLILIVAINAAYPVMAAESSDFIVSDATSVPMEDTAAGDEGRTEQWFSEGGGSLTDVTDAESVFDESSVENSESVSDAVSETDADVSYSESVPEDYMETDDPDAAESVSDVSAAEVTVPEESESAAEEMVGTGGDQYLSIVWQDGYIQRIKLTRAASEEALKSETQTILKTMGLSAERYKLSVTAKGITAKIVNKAYDAGDSEIRVLAHMGYYMTATKNTLSAYRVARALGYHYVGGDVRFTKDNVPVVIHDKTINATARNADGSIIGKTVTVRQCTYTELLKYDFGLSTDPVWKGEKIPTLEEYMTLCRKLGLIPNIHIKLDSGLTEDNFRSVAEIVLKTGMQGVATYAANAASYLKPIIELDPVSIVDLVITDKWDPHYVTDALSLKTGRNRVEIGIIPKLYAHSIAATCRFNGILLTTSANSETEAAELDSYVSMISTDGALPNAIIKGARRRSLHGGYNVKTDPASKTDYQLTAHANVGVVLQMISSMPDSEIKLGSNPSIREMSLFRFKKNAEGYYSIICSRNMLAIGVRGGSTKDGAAVVLTNRNPSYKAQMWKIIHNSDGSISFINRNSGKALQVLGDSQRSGIYYVQATYDGRSSQRFWLRRSSTQIDMKYLDSVVRLQPYGSNVAIGTAKNSAASGANVQAVGFAENTSQKYTLLYSGDGYYRIVNKKSGLCLTLTGTGSTGNIKAAAWNNKSSQRWKLVWNGSGSGMYAGTYRITCKQGNAVITIDGGASAGKNIRADLWAGKKVQQWRIKYAS